MREVELAEFSIGSLQEIDFLRLRWRDIVDFLHPLVIGLALDGSLGRQIRDAAQELCHLFVDGVRLPGLPANFEVWEETSVVEGEQVVSLHVSSFEGVLRVVDPGLPLFLDLVRPRESVF